MNKDSFFNWVFPSIFSLFGLTFLIVGILVYSKEMNFKENGVEHTAVIYDIQIHYDSDGDREHDVYIEYDIEDQTYRRPLNFYISSMNIGDEITIYYNPLNPMEIVSSSSSIFLLLVFGLLGGIFLLIGLIMLGVSIKKQTSKNALLASGTRVYADITDIDLNTSYSVNGRHPYVINCRWTNPASGITYLFKSGNLWFNPDFLIEEHHIISLSVYLNMEKPKKYYIDISELTDKVQDLT